MTYPSASEFDAWNTQKKRLHTSEPQILFKEGDVWWCSLGVNVGSETLGKGQAFTRPVIVLKKLSQEACVIVPVTSQPPRAIGTWFHQMHFAGRDQFAMMHQLRMVSVKRFTYRMLELPEPDFAELKVAVKGLLAL